MMLWLVFIFLIISVTSIDNQLSSLNAITDRIIELVTKGAFLGG
jgi:hypothetical protein